MKALAELDVEPGQRIRWRTRPPVVLRRTGPARVHLVQAAGGPLGGDELELRLRLAEGTELTVGSAGATVAQPSRSDDDGPARWTVTAELSEGARLRWWPEPTVVCDRARLHTELRLDVADGAAALVREEVRLGRYGQAGGAYRGALSVDHAGAPLLRHTTVLDGSDPALTGPGGTSGARHVVTVLGVGAVTGPAGDTPASGERPGLRWACHRLAGPGWLLVGIGEGGAALAEVAYRFTPEVALLGQPAGG